MLGRGQNIEVNTAAVRHIISPAHDQYQHLRRRNKASRESIVNSGCLGTNTHAFNGCHVGNGRFKKYT